MAIVLILDDDRDFRELLQQVLETRGCIVHHATRLAEARHLLKAQKPVLMIVNGLLPDGTGIQFIEERRKAGDPTKIVFLSAFWRDMKTYSSLTRNFDVALVLHKPIGGLEFAEYLDSLLGPQVPPAPALQPAVLTSDALAADVPLISVEAEAGEPDLLAAGLKKMRVDFEGKLAARLEELAHAIEQAKRHPASEWLDQATRFSHRLLGTAGSHGLHEVSHAAAQIEAELRLPEPDWDRAEGILNRMIATANIAPRASVHAGAWIAHVLLIHPDEKFTESTARMALQSLVRMTTLQSCDEVSQAARSQQLDAVLVDVDLALQDGQALENARVLADGRKIPFAVLANASEDTIARRIEAQHAGASLFLTLPLEIPALLDATRHLSAMHRATQANVLIVDDDPDFARLIELMLSSDGIATRVLHDPASLLEVLQEQTPDIILLDVDLPGMSGFDIGRMLRTHPRWRELPIFFLTSRTGVETRVVAYQAGGDDYLSKPVVREELLARVRLRLERNRLMREHRDHDALTNLLLRRPFLTALSRRLQEAKRKHVPLAVAIIDLDRFKHVNDTFGHAAGDRVLAQLGILMGNRYRSEDLRARWGGEELAIAFYGQERYTASALIERFLREFRLIEFTGDHDEKFSVTFSGGVASYPEDGDTVEALLRAADERMFMAKDAGRNRIHC
jgi:diguanylate cyclase (GGDEF)-like protein